METAFCCFAGTPSSGRCCCGMGVECMLRVFSQYSVIRGVLRGGISGSCSHTPLILSYLGLDMNPSSRSINCRLRPYPAGPLNGALFATSSAKNNCGKSRYGFEEH